MTAAETAFLAHAEYASLAMSERILSAKNEVHTSCLF